MIVLLMGVAGSGKTTVGQLLAARLGWDFVEGDDLHPEESVRKMSAGLALTDEDRRPWLERVRAAIDEHERAGRSAIVACSALKESYRRLLLDDTHDVRLVYLRGSSGLIERRLLARRGHFFDPALLASQLETLEEPRDAIVVDVADDPETLVLSIVRELGVDPETDEP